MAADSRIVDLNKKEAERFIAALEGAKQWVSHPGEEDLETRIHVISQILRGQRVSMEEINLLIGWYACNMPPSKHYNMSNVTLLQRVIDENNLPQKTLGQIVNQISTKAKYIKLEHPFMDPMDAITDLPILHGQYWTGSPSLEYRMAELAFHAIYRPQSISADTLCNYYGNFEDYKEFWEELVEGNKAESHVPRALVTQAQDALDNCMQEKLGVPRVVMKAIYRPEQVKTQELVEFFSHYDAHMEAIHDAFVRSGVSRDFEDKAIRAIAEVTKYHGVKIPEQARAVWHIAKPETPTEKQEVERFVSALKEAIPVMKNREDDSAARLRILAGAINKDSVSKEDIELINQYCDRKCRDLPPEERAKVFTNRELMETIARDRGFAPKYIDLAYKSLNDCARERNKKALDEEKPEEVVKVVYTVSPARLYESFERRHAPSEPRRNKIREILEDSQQSQQDTATQER